MKSPSFIVGRSVAQRLRIARQLGMVAALTISVSVQHAHSTPTTTVRTVALRGQPAPGAPSGAIFRDFYSLYFSLNDSGRVALLGSFTGGDGGGSNPGIWSEGSGALALVARAGDLSLDPNALLLFANLGSPVINNAGQTSFLFHGVTTFLNISDGIWSDRSGNLELIVGSGSPAPGAPSGVSFGNIAGSLFNEAGQTAFRAELVGAGVDASNNAGIWSEGSGSIALLARSGSRAPGAPDGFNFDVFSLPRLNDVGQTAFSAYVSSDQPSDFGQGIWSDRSGTLAPVVRSGIPAPGAQNGANFVGFSLYPALNNAGQTAFWAYLDGSDPAVGEPYDDGIWSEGSGDLSLIARRGSPAPGISDGITFGNQSLLTFDAPILNNAGKIAFRAQIDGPGVDTTNDEGIWWGTAGSLDLLARKGDHAPGTPDGVTFETFFPRNGALQMNDAGQIAFTAFLVDEAIPALPGAYGIWATDRAGTLQLVARTGDSLEIAPSDARTIAELGFVGEGTGGGDGLPSGINRRGQIAFWARFNDGDEGVFVTSIVAVPEPASVALFAIGAAALAMHRAGRRKAMLCLFVGLSIANPGQVAQADIFQWEYIDPANPGLGRQQSTTLAPDGAGAQVAHGANLSNHNLTKAYLRGADFYPIVWYDPDNDLYNYVPSNLNNTNLSQAELTNSRFVGATLNNANLSQTNLTGADFSTHYTYTSPPFRTSLTGANLSQANLTNANLSGVNLSGADLTAAEVRGANLGGGFPDGGLTSVQLYSTASYADRDLADIGLFSLNLPGVDLAGQNLTNAGLSGSNLTGADFSRSTLTNADFSFYTNLRGANFSHANLVNATFAGLYECGEFGCAEYPGATLTDATFNGADARGADFSLVVYGGADFNNTIMPDGHIGGLHLPSGEYLVVRDYDGNPTATPPITSAPILIYEYVAIDPGSALHLEFDADAWGSTISFDPGISVTLAGDLQLTFAPEVDVAAQVGRTIDLFNWTGVMPIGTFNVSSLHSWDLTNLYTTGEVTLTAAGSAIPGDFNGDQVVDAADLAEWKADYGVNGHSDADGDGDSDGTDFLIWQRQLGVGLKALRTVPEPTAMLLVGPALIVGLSRRSVKTARP